MNLRLALALQYDGNMANDMRVSFWVRGPVSVAMAFAVAAGGCGDDGAAVPDAAIVDGTVADDAPAPTWVNLIELPITPTPALDLLFVIDDSPSMADKQAKLSGALASFLAQLDAGDRGRPDLHIGVVTSDMGTSASSSPSGPAVGQPGNGGCTGTGDAGNLQTSGASVADTFLSDISNGTGGRIVNYTGQLDAVLEQMILGVGVGGCGFEQHLRAARAALEGNPMNSGFLRRAAALAVVVLADEDDCSAANATLFGPADATLGPVSSFRCFKFGVECSPDAPDTEGTKTGCAPRVGSAHVDHVSPFVTFLRGLKDHPRKVMFSTMAGAVTPVAVELVTPPGGGLAQSSLAPSCSYTGNLGLEIAVPPVRLDAVVSAFGAYGTRTSVCSSDVGSELSALGVAARGLTGNPCLEHASATLTPACEVVEARDATPTQLTPIPVCTTSPTSTCWEFITDAAHCPNHDHKRLQINNRTGTPPADLVTYLRCPA